MMPMTALACGLWAAGFSVVRLAVDTETEEVAPCSVKLIAYAARQLID